MSSRYRDEDSIPWGRIFGALTAIIAVIIVIYVIAHMITVDQGETCAVTTWGKQTGQVGPGFHMRGLGDEYHCFWGRRTSYEAALDPNTAQADYKEGAVETTTKDGQVIHFPFKVAYKIDTENVGHVYADVAKDNDRVKENVVAYFARPRVREIAQQYTAAQLYGGGGLNPDSPTSDTKLHEIRQRLIDILTPLYETQGVTLLDLEVNIPQFNPEYVAAIEKKQIAAENVQTAAFEANAETERARGQVERAKGEAGAEIERARGEAEAIGLRGKALQQYPEVLQLNLIQTLPSANVIYLPSDTVTPILDVGADATPTPTAAP